jgi:cell division protein ZapA (FtsZ GTPase activity inhibitor)
VSYRQEVLFDLSASPPLCEALAKLIPKIQELTEFTRSASDAESTVLQAIWRLGELELYVECVEDLSDALEQHGTHLTAKALVNLRSHLARIRAEDTFQQLKIELPKLRSGIKKKQSLTLGINLDNRLRPEAATLLSVNDFRYTENSLLGTFFSALRKRHGHATETTMFRMPRPEEIGLPPGSKIPLDPLFRDIETLLRSVARPIVRNLERYLRVTTAFLASLRPQLAFYLGAVKLMGSLKAAKLPVCKPTMESTDRRHTAAVGFYNLQLALRMIREHENTPLDGSTGAPKLVLNDIEFGDDGRIFILTGPNQGGKTTFTQGIGLLHLVAQAGLFVPAQAASVSPVDQICTHFPAEERGQLETGRLGEEAGRLKDIFHRITAQSLVLLNESLSSTSPAEAGYIAEDILKAMRRLGNRAVFATHLHDLAKRCTFINEQVKGESRIGSLVAGVEESDAEALSQDMMGGDPNGVERTYRIVAAPPAGQSFARDIARVHGISLEQITDTLSRRGVLEN